MLRTIPRRLARDALSERTAPLLEQMTQAHAVLVIRARSIRTLERAHVPRAQPEPFHPVELSHARRAPRGRRRAAKLERPAASRVLLGPTVRLRVREAACRAHRDTIPASAATPNRSVLPAHFLSARWACAALVLLGALAELEQLYACRAHGDITLIRMAPGRRRATLAHFLAAACVPAVRALLGAGALFRPRRAHPACRASTRRSRHCPVSPARRGHSPRPVLRTVWRAQLAPSLMRWAYRVALLVLKGSCARSPPHAKCQMLGSLQLERTTHPSHP
jgi:hypothetical protein